MNKVKCKRCGNVWYPGGPILMRFQLEGGKSADVCENCITELGMHKDDDKWCDNFFKSIIDKKS